jgi:hypothetical protein
VLEHHDQPNGTRRSRLGVVITIDYDDLTGRPRTATDAGHDTDAGDPDSGCGDTHDDDADASDDGHDDSSACGERPWLAGSGSLNGFEVPTETIRRWCCDANIHRLVTSGAAQPLDYGRATRTVSDSLFRLLTIRDGGCRFPGCDARPELCDAHHAHHWADDGETRHDNLPLLCWYHHRFVHDQHWRTEPLGAGLFNLITSTGERIPMRPPRITLRHIPFDRLAA